MKKIIVLSLILLTTIATVVNVYAASNFEISLEPSKKEVNKNEEVIVDVKISNIELDKGIIALGGTFEYDKDSLEVVKFEGGESWAKPSYNDENGKFATDRNDYGTNDETIFKVTFKVKDESKQNLTINLKEVTGSNGKDEVKLENIKTNITVKDGTSNPEEPTPGTNTTNNNTTNNNNTVNNDKNNNTVNNTVNNNTSNTNSNTNSNNTNTNVNSNVNNSNTNSNTTIMATTNSSDNVKGGIIPKTGANPILFGSIGVLIIVAASFYIRIRIIDSKAIKNNIIK